MEIRKILAGHINKVDRKKSDKIRKKSEISKNIKSDEVALSKEAKIYNESIELAKKAEADTAVREKLVNEVKDKIQKGYYQKHLDEIVDKIGDDVLKDLI